MPPMKRFNAKSGSRLDLFRKLAGLPTFLNDRVRNCAQLTIGLMPAQGNIHAHPKDRQRSSKPYAS